MSPVCADDIAHCDWPRGDMTYHRWLFENLSELVTKIEPPGGEQHGIRPQQDVYAY